MRLRGPLEAVRARQGRLRSMRARLRGGQEGHQCPHAPQSPSEGHHHRGRLAPVLGLTYSELYKSLWEAHHKKAVKDGGGACGLDNFETVCIWCHKKETATQAADAAHVRRVERQDQLPLLGGESSKHG